MEMPSVIPTGGCERHNVVGIDTSGSGNFHMGQSI